MGYASLSSLTLIAALGHTASCTATAKWTEEEISEVRSGVQSPEVPSGVESPELPSGASAEVPSGRCSPCSSEEDDTIKLPEELRGYCRYVVVRHPLDAQSYTVGVKYVKTTEGAVELCTNLAKNVGRKHKKHVNSWLCSSVVSGQECELADRCPNVHVTESGYENRRPWLRLAKSEKAEISPSKTEISSPRATENDTGFGTGSPTAAMLAGRRHSPPLPALSATGDNPWELLQKDQSLCISLPLSAGATNHTPYSLPLVETAPPQKMFSGDVLAANLEIIARAEHRFRLRRSSLRLMRRAVFPVGRLHRSSGVGLESSSWADQVDCQMDFSVFRRP